MADDLTNMPTQLPTSLLRVRQLSLVVAVLAAVIVVPGYWADPAGFFNGYLFGYWFWLAITLGSLGLLMLHTLTGGYWGEPLRGHLTAAARMAPVMGILIIPLILGRGQVWPWARPDLVAKSEILKIQAPWMNLNWIVGRTVIYFVIWSFLAMRMARLGRKWDQTGDRKVLGKMMATAAPGEVILALSITLAGVDYLMSRDAGWYSTMFGFILIGGMILLGIVFSLIIMRALRNTAPVRDLLTAEALIDIGGLFLAFTVFWFYVVFGQFLIIWMGDEKTDAFWFTNRGLGQYDNPWAWWAAGLALVGFLLPFLLLLQRPLKKNIMTLSGVALFILPIRLADIYFLIKPSGIGSTYDVTLTTTAIVRALWLDLPMPFLIGGIWMFIYLGNLASRPLAGRTIDEAPAHGPAHGPVRALGGAHG